MSDKPANSPIHIVPYGDDPLVALCEQLLRQQQYSLPDLSHITVLIAEPQAATRLRRVLLDLAKLQGHQALLGPHISTLNDWANRFLPTDIQICDPYSQELILVEALNQHRELIRSANPWTLADNLLSLFRELTLNKISLANDLPAFTRQLAQAYGMTQFNISALSHEAALVHSLWHAWHTQLHANDMVDAETAYQLALTNSIRLQQPGKLYLAGFHQLHEAEAQWLKKLLHEDRACLFLHGQSSVPAGQYHPDAVLTRLLQRLQVPYDPDYNPRSITKSPYVQAINTVYSREGQDLLKRSEAFSKEYPQSPLINRLNVFMANGAEEEARAIDIQVRLWLIEGRRQIGIITENRRVARRVRALLERADVHLHDAAGWALSTTSAAATLERWLECIEEDFSHLPLLDLLKSPFVFLLPDMSLTKEQIQQAAYRLEQDIIQHENIVRDLSRYRYHIHERRKRLPDWFSDSDQLMLELLQVMQQAASPLQALQQGMHDACVYLQALQTSMETIGMLQALDNDDAGSRLLLLITALLQAAKKTPLHMNWSEFRTWLGRNLERSNFKPPTHSPVQLMGLAQSRLQTFDAIIIASAERDHLPGKPANSPFFNETVRRELGLQTHSEKLAESFHHFRRLLESANQILITARKEQDGELVAISPWLENLQAFHRLAYAEPLKAVRIQALVHRHEAQVIRSDAHPLPSLQQQPRPSVTAQQLPQSYSPSSYQKLLNCPYQFYAAKCLKLSPAEEISLALSKNEYGQRVHLCLEAFHHDAVDLPGPFKGLLEETNREQAIDLLEKISDQVFAQDLADNFEHRGWLKQWQQIIPAYIDWQIIRAREWKVSQLEQKRKLQFKDGLTLTGQLDRIDRKTGALSIIDYKTGKVAKADDVINGENIQLPFYALLENLHSPDNRVQQVAYLQLDKAESVSKPHSLEGEQLESLSEAIAERLAKISEQMQQGKPLPAWGDSQTCQYCEIKQLCRRQAWEQD